MIHRRLLGIALIVLGIVCVYPGVALAQLDLDVSFQIPEPGTLVLISAGAAALAGIGWFRRRK